ncbi:gfo/Idh/MocA family oxidoreductase, partial [Clostridium perfringens]
TAEGRQAAHCSRPLDPAVLKLQGLLEEQAIGRIQIMDLYLEFPQWPRAWQQNPWITTRQHGGYLLEVGIHWIQMIQQVFGPITHVKSEIEFPPDSNQSESRVQAVLRLHNDTEIGLSGTDQREGEERVSLVVH